MTDTASRHPQSQFASPAGALENLRRVRLTCITDQTLADELRAALNALPAELRPATDKLLPLLTGLRNQGRAGTAAARRLVFVAARIHDWSDERRTAEYLLRHRAELADGRRSALALLSAARCAAEMDFRSSRAHEVPIEPNTLNRRSLDSPPARVEDASVADTVVDYLRAVLDDCPAGPEAWGRLHSAVTIAVELATELVDHGALSLCAMRSDARPGARLSCRLQREFTDRNVARSLARLLVGGDGTPIESALLWWVAHRANRADIPDWVRQRWERDLKDADPSLVTTRTRRRRAHAHFGQRMNGAVKRPMRTSRDISRHVAACPDNQVVDGD